MKKNNLENFNTEKPEITIIEASAGTGKTTTIIYLYIKSIINTKTFKNFKKIIILTFTNSIKQEIKKKIKENLKNFYLYIKNKKKKFSWYKELFNKIKNLKKTKKNIKNIIKNFESIKIYTIDSFFLKILKKKYFDYPNNISNKILKNKKNFLIKSIKDFWRKFIYKFPKNILINILKIYKKPTDLYKLVADKLQNYKDFKKIKKKNTNIIKKNKEIKKTIEKIKKLWNEKKYEINQILKNIKSNKRIYHKKNIEKWTSKINKWSSENTENYEYPKCLIHFCFNKIKKNSKYDKNKHDLSIFKKITKFLNTSLSLKKIFLNLALYHIPKIFKKNKEIENVVDFIDISKIFLQEIKKKKSEISQYIKKKIQVILIDEFQDINEIQQKIFIKMYQNSSKQSLILIGDPKQLIYNFRGANIFNYLKLKKISKNQYNLKKNFRSSKNLVLCINKIFSYKKNPFIYQEIKFNNSEYYEKNRNISFYISKKKQSAINISVSSQDSEITLEKYKEWGAQNCAKIIKIWLETGEKKILKKFNICYKKKISFKDIAILVKNKNEAKLIKNELNKLNISSVYTSNKENIFKSIESIEIFTILNAVLNPFNEIKIKKMLLTNLFNKTIKEIYFILNKKEKKIQEINKIQKYAKTWKENGIYETINEILTDYKNTINQQKKNIKNTIKFKKILFLAEILEKKSLEYTENFFLLKWLKKKIYEKKDEQKYIIQNIKKKEIRSIQIISIHKAKGLEFPLIYIPFFSHFYDYKHINLLEIEKDQKNTKKNNDFFKKKYLEKTSEEIRLLYVALTRSILHCHVNIAYIKEKKKNNLVKNFQNSWKYLFTYEEKENNTFFLKKINKIFKKKYISIMYEKKKSEKNNTIYKKKKYLIYKPNIKKIIIPTHTILENKKKEQCKKTIWKIWSYSKIFKKHEKNNVSYPILNKSLLKFKKLNKKSKEKKKNIHTFPKGKETGIFLHIILKNIKFYKKIKIKKFIQKKYFKIFIKWKKILLTWLNNIITSNLYPNNFSLQKLKKNEFIQEMKFIIPIPKIIDVKKFNKIIKKFDNITKSCEDIKIKKIFGMLQGSLDLIYTWNKKYYLIDYKTNWLGKNNTFYNKKNIIKEIKKKRYDIQYNLYSLVLHRYLKLKLKNYNFSNNFGGILYIFIRAYDNNQKKSDIFFKKPKYELIKKLDKLFSGKKK